MTVGSLFAGIGGFDLGFERAGFEIKWQVEIDDYAQRVLAKHWPGVRRYGDIRAIDWSDVEPVDVICGGFPCQPHSLAGRRGGARDERDLWGEFSRVIREVRPRWVVAENVPGLLSTESGRFFGRILRDLATCGYDAEWDCLPAAAFGAPHRRDRVWIVARVGNAHDGYSARDECERVQRASRSTSGSSALAYAMRARGQQDTGSASRDEGAHEGRAALYGDEPASGRQDVADAEVVSERAGLCADESGRVWGRRSRDGSDAGGFGLADVADAESGGQPMCERPSRGLQIARRTLGGAWATEPDVGRVAHGIPARVDRLKGLGNAIVPQIAQWIAERIKAAEEHP